MAKAPGKSRSTKSTRSGGARTKTTAGSRGAKTTAASRKTGTRSTAAAATSRTSARPSAAKATAPSRAASSRGAAKRPEQHRQGWSKDDVKELKALVKSNTPTPLMAHKLGRTLHATRAKARELGISLKPVNRSPYGRVKG
ncbi:MAG: hypothetical protein KIS96_10860 [Bauldia sp.]|nr:hypothetical protein [Bauldia sp.]